MGVKLKDLLPYKTVNFEELKGRYLAVDALNAIYQFLAIIRQPDGTPLMDHTGYVTSHLSGLFYRTINLLESEVYPIYVFDGEPPLLKKETIEERREIREQAREKWLHALQIGAIEEARKYAQASMEVNEAIIKEAKALLEAMGVPYIQAPSEGEAQAAFIVQRGDAWSTASQDFDSLLFGSPRLLRNLTLRGKRKLPGRQEYKEINLELFNLDEALKSLDITREQLVDIAILVGTDFNKGIKGIGPKKGYQLIKKYKTVDKVFKALNIPKEEIPPYEEIRKIFLEPNVISDYTIRFSNPNPEKIKEILCEMHDFSVERVEKAINRLSSLKTKGQQTSLEGWF
ncbi:MAG: flap endonuclease-1 [Candidatus Asgardarchaeia archaeon]